MAEVEDDGSAITIKVKDSNGEEVQFRVKKHMPMKKIFNAYAQNKGVALNAYSFTFDGQRLTMEHTPKMLEMEEGDQIDGGSHFICIFSKIRH